MSVALVLVSHSAALAQAVSQLAEQMTNGRVAIHLAAGAGENGADLGTDAISILDALNAADGPDGTLVLMDLGSALLSAEMARDLMDPDAAVRLRLVAAPFVEGAVAAAVAAAGGATLDAVAQEAEGALAPKKAQLGEPVAPVTVPPPPTSAGQTGTAEAVIQDPHGLHARPAAALSLEAARFACEITLTNLDTGRGPVSVKSMVALAGLGARAGHRLRVDATGPDAQAAANALATLIASFAGSGAATPPHSEEAAGEIIPVSPGIALGPLREIGHGRPDIPTAQAADRDAEVTRLRAAVARADAALEGASGPGADIIAVQRAFLADAALVPAAEARIRAEGHNAAQALVEAEQEAARIYADLDDPILKARAADLRDVVDRLLALLLGAPSARLPDAPPAILVADDLAPSLAHAMDPQQVLGVIDRRGGATSHAAILLRALGIPAIAGAAKHLPGTLPATAAFDGGTGDLVLEPSDAQRARFEARAAKAKGRPDLIQDGRVQLADGSHVELWANVSGPRDAQLARAAGAMGIGLLRTEIMFLDRADAPGEDEQAEALAATMAPFAGCPIVVRTLDAGGDKPLPFLKMKSEANPFLGVRGLRLSLVEMATFETQLRAILRAGAGHRLSIMLPMVTDADEIDAARAALGRALVELEARGVAHASNVALGIMVEVPGAALRARNLAAHADFFSIGTNDLTQYTLAAERGHPGLARFSDAGHPAVLNLVGRVAQAGARLNRHVAVCGEAAGEPRIARLLVGLGVHALSMSAGALPRVAEALAGARPQDLAAEARGVLGADA